jgi:glycosyltransferase involved in cell wall biosynthesis
MRIGLINEYFPPFAPGGAEWSSLALAKALAQHHEVRVITPNYGSDDVEVMGGVEVRRFPSPVKLSGQAVSVHMRWLANPGFYRRVAVALLRAAAEKPFDILHVQAKYSLPGAYWAARRLGVPIVYTIRDTSILCPTGQCLMEYEPVHPGCGRFSFWWQCCRRLYMDRYMQNVPHLWRIQLALIWQQAHVRLFRAALRRVDGVIGVSEGILQVYRTAGLKLGRHSAVIYNLPPVNNEVDREQVTAVKQAYHIQAAPTVLYAGKFSFGKGTQILVQAADKVIEQIPTTQFLFAGYGDLHLNSPHMRNLGRLPHDQLLALYQLADVVVIPSLVLESLSRVGLEAMAAGKPLIGTNVGGTPEQIEDGVTGYVVRRKEPAALAEAIVKVLADDALRQSMGQAAQKRVATKFSHEVNLQKMQDFYDFLLKRR